MSVKHKCEKCKWETKEDAECYCMACVDEAKEKSYEEGFEDARKQYDPEK